MKEESERDRIFGDWLAGHKGILFKMVHAYAFDHADRQDLFQEIVFQALGGCVPRRIICAHVDVPGRPQHGDRVDT